MCKNLYRTIWEVEMAVFMRMKMDPFALESNMTILDLQNFLMMWNARVEEDNKEREKSGSNGDRLMKSLKSIRDILNYMFGPVD